MTEKPIRPGEMSANQYRCYAMLCDAVGGSHHIYGKVFPATDNGITTVISGSLATFDGDALTRLVVLAHDYCVRLEVSPASSRHLRLYLHARYREGSIWKRHPNIHRAVANHHDGMRAFVRIDEPQKGG